MKSVSPAPGDVQIGGTCYGLSDIMITMDGAWDNSVYNTASQPLPEGLTLVGPDGPVTIAPDYGFQMWSLTDYFTIRTEPYNLTTPRLLYAHHSRGHQHHQRQSQPRNGVHLERPDQKRICV